MLRVVHCLILTLRVGSGRGHELWLVGREGVYLDINVHVI